MAHWTVSEYHLADFPHFRLFSQGLNTGSNPVVDQTERARSGGSSSEAHLHCCRRIKPTWIFFLIPHFVRAARYSGGAFLHEAGGSTPSVISPYLRLLDPEPLSLYPIRFA